MPGEATSGYGARAAGRASPRRADRGGHRRALAAFAAASRGSVRTSTRSSPRAGWSECPSTDGGDGGARAGAAPTSIRRGRRRPSSCRPSTTCSGTAPFAGRVLRLRPSDRGLQARAAASVRLLRAAAALARPDRRARRPQVGSQARACSSSRRSIASNGVRASAALDDGVRPGARPAARSRRPGLRRAMRLVSRGARPAASRCAHSCWTDRRPACWTRFAGSASSSSTRSRRSRPRSSSSSGAGSARTTPPSSTGCSGRRGKLFEWNAFIWPIEDLPSFVR